MKIKANMLSHKGLVSLVDGLLGAIGYRADELLVEAYRNDLGQQLHAIVAEIEAIEKELERKRIPQKERNTLALKHGKLCVRFYKKRDAFKKVEANYEERKNANKS